MQSKASDFVPYNESTNKQNYSNFLDSVEKDAEEKSKFDDIFINPYENVEDECSDPLPLNLFKNFSIKQSEEEKGDED